MSAKGWIIGGGAAAIAVGAGAATWAAVSFFSAGPQAGEALPADTLAYVSLDLNPSGKQKIAALKVANKFPALRKELGLKTTDDVRRKLIEGITHEAGCSIDYAKDVEPWIGSTVALAVVDKAAPKPVVALEVGDKAKADKGARALLDCAGTKDEPLAFAIDGGWMIIGEDQATVKDVIAAADDKSLADDASFKKWTSETGDQGILTAYAAPAAPDALLGLVDNLGDSLAGASGLSGFSQGVESGLAAGSGFDDICPDGDKNGEAAKSALSGFKGGAATIRFGGKGLEVAFAMDGGTGSSTSTELSGVEDLPSNLGAAFGMGFGKNWAEEQIDALTKVCGEGDQKAKLYQKISKATGLDLPADLNTLTSKSAQLVVGSDFSFESLMTDENAGLPLALRIKGDPTAIKAVLAKVEAKVQPQIDAGLGGFFGLSHLFEVSTGTDSATIGLSADLREEVAKGGTLGKDASFKAAVPEADKATSVFYLSFGGVKDLVADGADGFLASGDDSSVTSEVDENMAPLDSFGVSGWLDGSVSRGRLVLAVK
jgi:hypothetical protein